LTHCGIIIEIKGANFMAIQLTWNAFTTLDQDHYSDTDVKAPAVKAKVLTPVSMPVPVQALTPTETVIEKVIVQIEGHY